MSEVGHALVVAGLAIVGSALAVFVLFALVITEMDEDRILVTNITLRRVFWGFACLYWAYDMSSFFLGFVWNFSPSRLMIVSLAIAIITTGVLAIRGFRTAGRAAAKS